MVQTKQDTRQGTNMKYNTQDNYSRVKKSMNIKKCKQCSSSSSILWVPEDIYECRIWWDPWVSAHVMSLGAAGCWGARGEELELALLLDNNLIKSKLIHNIPNRQHVSLLIMLQSDKRGALGMKVSVGFYPVQCHSGKDHILLLWRFLWCFNTIANKPDVRSYSLARLAWFEEVVNCKLCLAGVQLVVWLVSQPSHSRNIRQHDHLFCQCDHLERRNCSPIPAYSTK